MMSRTSTSGVALDQHRLRPGIGRASGVLWALVVSPALLAAWLVYQMGVDVPIWDEWTIAEFLQHVDAGTLALRALFSQHNEHRMFVPRALQLAVALVVGWDTRVLMWLTQGVLVAIAAGNIILWRRSVESRAPWALLSLALVTCIIFSPAQHQNLFWGFQICFYVPGACLLAFTIVIGQRGYSLGRSLAAAVILSTIATFSIFPGLLTWPLAAMAVLLAHGPPLRSTAWKWCLWALCSVCVVGLYFASYEAPPHSPSPTGALRSPVTVLAGLATCVGSPLSFGAERVRSAMIVGTVATAGLVWLALCLWRLRADRELMMRVRPWVVMSGFGITSAAAITLGRVGYGYEALLESRYAALSGWVLIGAVMIAAVLRDRAGTQAATRTWGVVCGTIAILFTISLPHHLAEAHATYRERLQSQSVYLFADAAPSGWPMVPPWLDWPTIKQRLADVERAGWRNSRPEAPAWVDSDRHSPDCGFGTVEFAVMVGPRVMAGGWAVLPAKGRSADAVILTSGPTRRILTVQVPLIGRGDIGDRFQAAEALVSGWVIDTRATSSVAPLEFWALDVEAVRAYRLCQNANEPGSWRSP